MSEYLDALKFLQSEIVRLHARLLEPAEGAPRLDFLYSIRAPDGRGSLICGRAAAERLQAASKLAIARNHLTNRLTVSKVTDAVAQGWAKNVWEPGSALDTRLADKLFARAIRDAKASIGPRTHFIPCMLSGGSTPSSFSIGPIRFDGRKQCIDRITPLIDAYRKSESQPGLLDDILGYYENFDHIAEVTIEGADPECSRKLAAEAVETGLDFIRMLLGARYGSRVRAFGENTLQAITGQFEVVNGAIDGLRYSRASLTRNLGDGWWDYLTERGAADVLPIIGKVVSQGLSARPAPLAQRLLDAAHWYGDAVREKNPAAQIVKFVTAIERLVITEKAKDLTKTFSDRGSALICHPRREDVADARRQFTKVYDARSQFVHGSSSPFEEKYLNVLADAEDLSRSVLWSALRMFDEGGRLEDSRMTDDLLGQGYDNLVAVMFASKVGGRSSDQ